MCVSSVVVVVALRLKISSGAFRVDVGDRAHHRDDLAHLRLEKARLQTRSVRRGRLSCHGVASSHEESIQVVV